MNMQGRKIKAAFVWNWKNTFVSMGIFYGIMLLVNSLLSIIFYVSGITEGSMQLRMSATIWLFVMGIVLYGQGIRVCLSMGVSRRSFILAYSVYMLSLAAAACVVNILLETIFQRTAGGLGGNTLVLSVTPGGLGISTRPAEYASRLAYAASYAVSSLMGCLLSVVCGAFIGAAYYKMGRLAKVGVSIGVPLALVAAVSLALAGALPSEAYTVINAFLQWVAASAVNGWLLALGSAVILLLCVWLMSRRAPIKGASVATM